MTNQADDISPDQLYDLYVDTMARCSSSLLHKNDDDIAYDLFEEFDIGACSFLHVTSLTILHDAGYIDDVLMHLSMAIRHQWFFLQKGTYSLSEIRTDKQWRRLYAMGDIINDILATSS